MDDLHRFGRIVSGNRRKNQPFNSEARAFMLGAVAGGASHTTVANAMNCIPQTVSRYVNCYEEQHGFKISYPSQSHELETKDKQKMRLNHLTHQMARSAGKSTRDEGRIEPIVRTSTRWRHRPHLKRWRAAKRSGLNRRDTQKRLRFGRKKSSAAML
ncbi:hypothetical protein F4821DRAFT_139036 [Hypoxylon rubiginosum]|uniref:Uncharacterized protein n=1 Tax=Hypoxylon rubiginosum TaxID=110542 RepID=A0ACC0CZW8_9PEZI|nr:hypothetical protein F4821DRAFT_139036 [Hypoxylon rubiginosum]